MGNKFKNNCYLLMSSKFLYFTLALVMLSTVLTKTQRRRLAELKPVKHQHHKTGGSCATVTPASQADCYRSKGQKPTKEALEFEKKAKAKRNLAALKPVKAKKVKVGGHTKVGGSCGTVAPAYQAQCYRDHGLKVPKEALEREKAGRKLAEIKPVKAKKVKVGGHTKVGGSCGTVAPA